MKLQPGAHLADGPFKLWQLAGVFLPFYIPLFTVVLDLFSRIISPGLVYTLGALFVGLLGIVCIISLTKKFPIWTLPSLGLFLFILVGGLKLIFQTLTLIALSPFWGSFWPDSILLRLVMVPWFNLIYIAIASILIVTLLVLSQRLLQLARTDWSLLSFLVYPFTIPYVIMNDEFRGLEPYQLAAILILVTGAVFFVILPSRRTRLLALLAASLAALSTVSLGLYQIFPAQEFASSISSFRLWEALQPVLDLPALLILLCLPVLVRRLPPSFGSAHPSSVP